VTDHKAIIEMTSQDLPSDLYPLMLSEAILQRELPSVVTLVSTWPQAMLNVYDVIPLEDYIESGYLTLPTEGHSMCILDGFILGLLQQKPSSNLKFVDFTGFHKGRITRLLLLSLPLCSSLRTSLLLLSLLHCHCVTACVPHCYC
jgi:hypothetical protein